MGLRERLENLVVNPRLVESGGDVDFAKSLLEYYNKKGSLSSGRREWLDKLEVKYDEENWVNPLDNADGKTIKEILANPELTERDRAFVESLRGGLARFGSLSDRQGYALGKIAERYTKEGIAKRSAWLGTTATLPTRFLMTKGSFLLKSNTRQSLRTSTLRRSSLLLWQKLSTLSTAWLRGEPPVVVRCVARRHLSLRSMPPRSSTLQRE